MRGPAIVFVISLFVALACGCKMRDESEKPHASANAASPPPRRSAGRPSLLRGEVRGGDVTAAVRRELERAKPEGRHVLVYVGASWCEPCQRFHAALEAGRLDSEFSNVTFLEFDLDEERGPLSSAGYASQYIPLFALPQSDGRSSGKHVEGSVKGDGAVGELVKRLRDLLASR